MRMNFFFQKLCDIYGQSGEGREEEALREQFKMLIITLGKTPSQSDYLNAIKAEKY